MGTDQQKRGAEASLRSERGLQAILIDLDGTLIDSIPVLYSVYDQFMARQGFVGSEEEFEELKGASLCEIVRILAERYGIHGSLDEYKQLLKACYQDEVQPFPGARECLLMLQERGYRLACVTSGSEEMACRILDRVDFLNHLEILVGDNGQRRVKPDPDLYLTALEGLQIYPKEALAIEDSLQGIGASLAAGIPTLGFFPRGVPQGMPREIHGMRSWGDIQKWLA